MAFESEDVIRMVIYESSDPEKLTIADSLITGKTVTIAPVTITIKTINGEKLILVS